MVDNTEIDKQIKQMKAELKPMIETIAKTMDKLEDTTFAANISWARSSRRVFEFQKAKSERCEDRTCALCPNYYFDMKKMPNDAANALEKIMRDTDRKNRSEDYVGGFFETCLQQERYELREDTEKKIRRILEPVGVATHKDKEFEPTIDRLLHREELFPRLLVGLSMILEGTPYTDCCAGLIERAKQKLTQEEQVRNPLAKDGEKLEAPAFASRPIPSQQAPKTNKVRENLPFA